MNQILVATDGSAGAAAAIDEGLALATELGAEVTFVSVYKPPSRMLGDPFYERSIRQGLREARAAGDDALARARAAGVPASAEILEGDAADEIVALADNRDADLIVVGSRGYGPLVGALLGSVSAGIVQQARRPVVIVHPAAEKRETRAA